jgi:hypothetical protein
MKKSKQIKVVFKEHRRTGLFAIGAGLYIEVKYKGEQVALITGGEMPMNNPMVLMVKVRDANSGSGWHWEFIKLPFGKSQKEEIRQYVRDRITDIFEAFPVFIPEKKPKEAA